MKCFKRYGILTCLHTRCTQSKRGVHVHAHTGVTASHICSICVCMRVCACVRACVSHGVICFCHAQRDQVSPELAKAVRRDIRLVCVRARARVCQKHRQRQLYPISTTSAAATAVPPSSRHHQSPAVLVIMTTTGKTSANSRTCSRRASSP
jgi:hypothetical protein